MISKKIGFVEEILKENLEIEEIVVSINMKKYKAYNYHKLTGHVSVGDKVLLNTTAVDLNLGTGGYHFVVSNFNNMESDLTGEGHIMKLRYTPMQLKVNAVEEQDSIYHDKINNFETLDDLRVVVGELHSMLVPFACSYKKENPDKKLVYIMTDGAALPVYLSQAVSDLKDKNVISETITIGNAFGGDYECINIYTALITAKEILKADCVFVSMGPGIAGTGTKYGYTGVEQGPILDAVYKLGGTPIVIPRVSFSDKRERHIGLSHHTITLLRDVVNVPVNIVFNILDEEKENIIKAQIKENKIIENHRIFYLKNEDIKNNIDFYNMKVKTMGRGYDEDREFFDCAGGASSII